MKRFLIATTGVAIFVAMALAAGNGHAFGKGSFKASDTTVGHFNFHAGAKDKTVRGSLWFAEVGPRGDHPVHTLRMKVGRFAADKGSAGFSGKCLFDGKEGVAEVHVGDTGRGQRGDWISISVGDDAGNSRYAVKGIVGRGDIVVRSE